VIPPPPAFEHKEMSLNGLDNAKVKEAHDAAIAELGGW
jgi:hypothetical protein